jgi:hypothetical protein
MSFVIHKKYVKNLLDAFAPAGHASHPFGHFWFVRGRIYGSNGVAGWLLPNLSQACRGPAKCFFNHGPTGDIPFKSGDLDQVN